MIGIPGCGKSTYCHKNLKQYVYINQDTLGSRHECESLMDLCLKSNANVVIDRTNINKSQRRYFLNIAKQYNAYVIGVHLKIPLEDCMRRVLERTGHPTMLESMPDEKKLDIVSMFHNMFEAPDKSEGFDEIVEITVDKQG